MSDHTPGPWVTTMPLPDGSCYVGAKPATEDAILVAWVRPTSNIEPPNAEANARLIAAAPELLAALTFLTNTIDPYSDWNDDGFQKGLRMAAAAIAKAEGHS